MRWFADLTKKFKLVVGCLQTAQHKSSFSPLPRAKLALKFCKKPAKHSNWKTVVRFWKHLGEMYSDEMGNEKNMLRLIVLLKVQSDVWTNAMCKLAKAADRYKKESEILLGRETNKLLPHYTLKKKLCCYPRPTEIEGSKAVICYQHKTIHLSDGYFGLLLPKLPSSDVSTNLNCDQVSTWLNWTSWYWQLPTLQFGVAKVYWISLGIAANLYSIESNYAPHTDSLTDCTLMQYPISCGKIWRQASILSRFKLHFSDVCGSIYHKD